MIWENKENAFGGFTEAQGHPPRWKSQSVWTSGKISKLFKH